MAGEQMHFREIEEWARLYEKTAAEMMDDEWGEPMDEPEEPRMNLDLEVALSGKHLGWTCHCGHLPSMWSSTTWATWNISTSPARSTRPLQSWARRGRRSSARGTLPLTRRVRRRGVVIDERGQERLFDERDLGAPSPEVPARHHAKRSAERGDVPQDAIVAPTLTNYGKDWNDDPGRDGGALVVVPAVRPKEPK